MLNVNIREATKSSHQQLEKKVVLKLKAIRNHADYADLLRYFYSYFSQVEKAVAPYITAAILPDLADRRNSSYLKNDIIALGGNVEDLPAASIPAVTNVLQAIGAMYVMEGSIMGGSIIVQMLQKAGITTGVSFFSGYGEATGQKWGVFTAVMNEQAKNEADENIAIEAANETFALFAEMFDEVNV